MTLKRWRLEREVTTTKELISFIFGETSDEAVAKLLTGDGGEESVSEVVGEPTFSSIPGEMPFEDNRHPLLIPLEGQKVRITLPDGRAVEGWVTPFGKGTLNPWNSVITSQISATKRWGCEQGVQPDWDIKVEHLGVAK